MKEIIFLFQIFIKMLSSISNFLTVVGF